MMGKREEDEESIAQYVSRGKDEGKHHGGTTTRVTMAWNYTIGWDLSDYRCWIRQDRRNIGEKRKVECCTKDTILAILKLKIKECIEKKSAFK